MTSAEGSLDFQPRGDVPFPFCIKNEHIVSIPPTPVNSHAAFHTSFGARGPPVCLGSSLASFEPFRCLDCQRHTRLQGTPTSPRVQHAPALLAWFPNNSASCDPGLWAQPRRHASERPVAIPGIPGRPLEPSNLDLELVRRNNITPYCAEFVNTVTNVIFIHLGIMGIRDCLRYGHDRVFIISYLGYIIVGLGSMLFHATLKYSMQLADELPMIYTTCIMAFATFSYSRPRRLTVLIGVGLVALAAFITVYYHLSQNPVFHQVAYASLTCAVVFRGMYVMEAHLRPALKGRSETPAHADEIMKQMWSMAVTGIALFLIGFFIWNMDNIYCGHLRNLRSSVLLPWSVIFEGHGWWHIFTGLGAYYFIIWRVWLTRCLDGSEREFMLRWPSPFTSVPKVVPRPGATKANGNGVNGTSKKVL